MKWVAPIASVVVGALSAFEPNIQGLIAQHPALAGVFGMIGMLAASFAQQPHK